MSAASAVVSGGLGAAAATVLAAGIQVWGKRGESRATAADLISEAAGALASRQSETIGRLEARIDRQTQAIIALTAILDELLPQIAVDDSEKTKLRAAIHAAKLAL